MVNVSKTMSAKTRTNNNKKKGAVNNAQSRKVTAPVATASIMVTGKPRISGLESNSVRIVNREYFRDVLGSVPYSAQATQINPGNNIMFPWLSGIAANYESYMFRKLKFFYEPICSTVTSGSLMMAIDYDSTDAVAPSKAILMAYEGAVRTSPWAQAICNANRADKILQKRFVNIGSVPAGTDIRLNNVGFLTVASEQVPSGDASIGEMYVEYEIEFYIPQLQFNVPGFASGEAQANSVAAPIPIATPLLNGISQGILAIAAGKTLLPQRTGRFLLDVAGKFYGSPGASWSVTSALPATLQFLNETIDTTNETIGSTFVWNVNNLLTDTVNLEGPAGATGLNNVFARVAPYLFN